MASSGRRLITQWALSFYPHDQEQKAIPYISMAEFLYNRAIADGMEC